MTKGADTSVILPPRAFFLFFLAAVTGIMLWMFLSYARISAVSLKFDRSAARQIARDYLQDKQHVDASIYSTAVVFESNVSADRYLQRTIGADAAVALREAYDNDLVYWLVRFFIPGQQEEYSVIVSPRTGEVASFGHTIPETAARPAMSQEDAKETAQKFLFGVGVHLDDYEIKDEVRTVHDNRTDYAFSWKHKAVDIPWTSDPDGGSAKLLTGATVSGGDILGFFKSGISVPERFNRFLDKEQEVGRNLSLAFGIIYIFMIVAAIVEIVRSRQHLAMRTLQPFLKRLGIFLGLVLFLSALNQHENTLMGYATTHDLTAFLGRVYVRSAVSIFFFLVGLTLVILAGESLRSRSATGAPVGDRLSFLMYARSSFMTRGVAVTIVVGYLLACVLLGMQALVVRLGEMYCGVWVEEQWVAQFSTAYWPFLAAFAVGVQASVWEESLFRVFIFHWLKERTGRVVAAAVAAAVLWGFGHSGYLVFPMWFRGIEVTLLGLVMAWAYLRYGLLTVLAAHFLFDAFWGSAGLLFSRSAPLYFWSAVAILALPLGWAVLAWRLNRPGDLSPLNWNLNPAQRFHLKVLEAYVAKALQEKVDPTALRKDCLTHGWDPAVVDKALGESSAENDGAGEKNKCGA